MKIEKVETVGVRIKMADGSAGEEDFVLSLLADGSGVVVEFENEKYLISTEEIIKEVVRRRDEF